MSSYPEDNRCIGHTREPRNSLLQYCSGSKTAEGWFLSFTYLNVTLRQFATWKTLIKIRRTTTVCIALALSCLHIWRKYTMQYMQTKAALWIFNCSIWNLENKFLKWFIRFSLIPIVLMIAKFCLVNFHQQCAQFSLLVLAK